ncbi:NH(3)-dependent NAD(+) synthetase [Thermanaeromonas toyohensis ToBE]|uniref:NH(3)-dependent NAD(+) synthetase n=1 Tax=Thermanaeromonas toyohensis ToBE TaxID=698762 RepID=A0A1W1VXZ1_9FIRM|nr:NAD(+) synthase [Thermanaeromonas toyohensis]SMB98252.1 NH(3)-dependent NAD(+) synthetase [Thermanaeromonas toyohensis ToBE]
MEELAQKLVSWIQEKVKEGGCRGVVFGLSGGVDSATVAALCHRAFPKACLGLIMPCHSHPRDAEDARRVAEIFSIPVKTVLLDPVYDTLVEALTGHPYDPEKRSLALANLKPRLRMTVLYYWANELNYLVVGTGNRSELAVGYFTKYGDGGVDILPLGNLVKTQVRELASYLGVPKEIINKPPSAGLWEGQTDEGEMGLTYAELDHYLLTGEAPPKVAERIKALATGSEHKRRLPAIPPF